MGALFATPRKNQEPPFRLRHLPPQAGEGKVAAAGAARRASHKDVASTSCPQG